MTELLVAALDQSVQNYRSANARVSVVPVNSTVQRPHVLSRVAVREWGSSWLLVMVRSIISWVGQDSRLKQPASQQISAKNKIDLTIEMSYFAKNVLCTNLNHLSEKLIHWRWLLWTPWHTPWNQKTLTLPLTPKTTLELILAFSKSHGVVSPSKSPPTWQESWFDLVFEADGRCWSGGSVGKVNWKHLQPVFQQFYCVIFGCVLH